MRVLFVDACPRSESRTRKLAQAVLNNLSGDVNTVRLSDNILPCIDEAALNKRTEDSSKLDFSDDMYSFAKDFANADEIVVAAPFWDQSFPAILKKYIEVITVTNLTFKYSEQGAPIGLCKANNLYYVTTAGGPIFNEEYGYGYIKMLATAMYGVKQCHIFKAEGLDIYGADINGIMTKAEASIAEYFK